MGSPMYRQIAEDLREQIESGQLEPGQQLRTELELRDHYGASRNTVRDAIKWLTTLGLVETKPGQGTFVARKMDPFVTTLSGDPEIPTTARWTMAPRARPGQTRLEYSTDPQVEIQKTSARSPTSCGSPRARRSSVGTSGASSTESLVNADIFLSDGVR